jgi:DNA-binding NtrC family response regulator
MRMPKLGGMEVLKSVKRNSPDTKVIVITAYGTVNTAVEAMKEGASEFIMKPFSLEDLETVVKNVLTENGEDGNQTEPEESTTTGGAREIVTRDPQMLSLLDMLKTVARSKSTVLIQGESGTGKELIARHIHRFSPRVQMPFIAINCAAVPHNLLESEMFGYEKGAFTGAAQRRLGKFELADGGTIFLDEIAETPLELQGVLLRVIEDKSVMRIGGQRVRPVDVRVIAATNKDLREEVRKGNFREDLYYRLNVFAIYLVPLSERQEDIPILLSCFINKYGEILGKQIDRIDPQIMELFLRYPWPGNIRELQNVVERMMNFTRTGELTTEFIPQEILDFQPVPDNRSGAGRAKPKETMETNAQVMEVDKREFSPKDSERDTIAQMIEMGIKKKQIAQKLGMSRMTIYRKMKKYNLN